MELYLMQHGRPLSEAEDPERRLSGEGREEVRASALAIKHLGLFFDQILSSPKARARETAEIVAEVLGYPLEGIKVHQEFKPLVPPAESVAVIKKTAVERLLIVGHLPSLAEIVSYLVSGAPGIKVHFKMAGLCALSSSDLSPGSAELLWHLWPEHLARLAP
ncbi:phosphohistidine phosphatase SixA [Thermosulfuriphilus sp.]